MTRVLLTPAVLVHRRGFRESSLLLDFLTREYGRIRLVGRGARKAKGALQMFQRVNISFVGRGELKTLTGWEVDDEPRWLVGETLILGVYVNELIVRLVPEGDLCVGVFEDYWGFICGVGGLERWGQHWLLRMFEHKLLRELGYGVDCERDVEGGEIEEGCFYEYQAQAGFLLSGTGRISGGLIGLLAAEGVTELPDMGQLRVGRDLNRVRLGALLGDRPLRSRALFFKG